MDGVFDGKYECEGQLSLFEEEITISGWSENAMSPPMESEEE